LAAQQAKLIQITKTSTILTVLITVVVLCWTIAVVVWAALAHSDGVRLWRSEPACFLRHDLPYHRNVATGVGVFSYAMMLCGCVYASSVYRRRLRAMPDRLKLAMELKLTMMFWGAIVVASILLGFPFRSELKWKPVVWGTLVVLVDLTTIWWRVAETFFSENNRQFDGTLFFCLYFILKVYAGILYCVCAYVPVFARIDAISAR
jgi:hypothetical protein